MVTRKATNNETFILQTYILAIWFNTCGLYSCGYIWYWQFSVIYTIRILWQIELQKKNRLTPKKQKNKKENPQQQQNKEREAQHAHLS